MIEFWSLDHSDSLYFVHFQKEVLNYKFCVFLEIHKEKTEKQEKTERKILTKGNCLILCLLLFLFRIYILCIHMEERKIFMWSVPLF